MFYICQSLAEPGLMIRNSQALSTCVSVQRASSGGDSIPEEGASMAKGSKWAAGLVETASEPHLFLVLCSMVSKIQRMFWPIGPSLKQRFWRPAERFEVSEAGANKNKYMEQVVMDQWGVGGGYKGTPQSCNKGLCFSPDSGRRCVDSNPYSQGPSKVVRAEYRKETSFSHFSP